MDRQAIPQLPGHERLGGDVCALTVELADKIALLVAEGKSNRQIAQDLDQNLWTVLHWRSRGTGEIHLYLQERVRLAREAQPDELAADMLRRARECPPNILTLRPFGNSPTW